MGAVLIGLNGRRGAGKDTAYGYIHEWAGERRVSTQRRGFADALKLSFCRLFVPNISLDEAVVWCDRLKATSTITLEDEAIQPEQSEWSEQKTKLTHEIPGRVALQRYGTECHRQVFGDDFWVDALLPKEGWEQNFSTFSHFPFGEGSADICVVTDVRFPNEAERIRELGGQVWEVVRWDEGDRDRHPSEQKLDDSLIDLKIDNRHDLVEFGANVKSAMSRRFGFRFDNTAGMDGQVPDTDALHAPAKV